MVLYDEIYKVLTGITTNVEYKVIPENYNFSDLLVVFIIKKNESITYYTGSITSETLNMKIKVFDKNEETCINTTNDIIRVITRYKNNNIRKIEFNYTDSLYDDLLDVNSLIIDFTITNDLE
jgi:hypothetical protein